MSRRALQQHKSHSDDNNSMIPLQRSSKEPDFLSPSAKHEETCSDDTDDDQDWSEEFVMKHHEPSMDNLDVYIAKRRKIETYLQQYSDSELELSSSEESESLKGILVQAYQNKDDSEIINLDDEQS